MDSDEECTIKRKSLRCQICVKIPLGKVFQCYYGHMICRTCSKKVGGRCPSCRVSLRGHKFRNLAIEAILDEIMIPCTFMKYGCGEKLKRNEVLAHKKVCKFRGYNMCRNFFGLNCKASVRSSAALLNHLKRGHNGTMGKSTFSTKTTMCIEYQENLICCKNYVKHITPTELSGGKESFVPVVRFVSNSCEPPSYYCTVIYLGDSKSVKADFKFDINVVNQHDQEMTHICTYTGSTVQYRATENAEVSPFFRTSVDYIKRRLEPRKTTNFKLIFGVELTNFKGDDEDNNFNDSAASGSSADDRSRKRHLPPPTNTPKLMKSD